MDEMAKPRGLVLRDRIFYYRKRIPRDLVERYGKSEVWVSLDTDNFELSVGRYHEEAAKLEAEFNAIRHRRSLFNEPHSHSISVNALKVTEEEAIAVARALVVQRLSGIENENSSRRRQPNKQELTDYEVELSGDIGRLLDPNNDEGNQFVQSAAKHAYKNYGYDFNVLNDNNRRPLELIRRALIAVYRIEMARLGGDYSDNPRDTLFHDLEKDDALELRKGERFEETVSSAMEKFWDRKISLEPKAPKTLSKYKAYSAVVVQFFGPDTPMRSISRDRCHQFRDLIARLPPNYSKTKDAPPAGSSLEEVVAYADRKNLERIAYATQELYLARMITFFTWAKLEGITPHLEVSDIRPRGKAPEKASLRQSFTASQLASIFSSPIFVGCKDDGRGFKKPGENIIKRSRYWMPLIGLCTGMRESEILKLSSSNIKYTVKGNAFIDLTREVGKNKFSRREVPIHSILIGAGFLDFVEKKRKLIDDRLFPDVPTGADGTQTSIFSKRFATFLRGCGIKDVDTETCFHMFRHTLKDALDRGNVPEEISEAIQGWSRSMKMSRSYGDGKEADTLKPWIEKAVFPDFDKHHLTASHRNALDRYA